MSFFLFYKVVVTLPNIGGKTWNISVFSQKLEQFSTQQCFQCPKLFFDLEIRKKSHLFELLAVTDQRFFLVCTCDENQSSGRNQTTTAAASSKSKKKIRTLKALLR